MCAEHDEVGAPSLRLTHDHVRRGTGDGLEHGSLHGDAAPAHEVSRPLEDLPAHLLHRVDVLTRVRSKLESRDGEKLVDDVHEQQPGLLIGR